MVLADLECVVRGATLWLPGWVRRRRRRNDGGHRGRGRIANRDLWEQLQGAVERLHEGGTEVAFWLVEPGNITVREPTLFRKAKSVAREAARRDPVYPTDEYTKLCGLLT